MRSPSAEPTLSDFLRTLRNHWLIFTTVVVVAIAAPIAYSLTQKKTYTAKASLAIQDESRDLALVGVTLAPTQTADQLAASAAETIIQPHVVSRVRADLKSRQSISDLSGSVSASVQPNSNLVVITTTAGTAARAQALANAFAKEGASAANDNARRTFAAEARELRRQQPSKGDPNAKALVEGQVARLGALGTIASPAQVASFARLPSAPTSPRPVRNALLGAGLGIVLGLLAVFARDSFDNRVRRARDIQSELDMPLLGAIGEPLLGHGARPGKDKSVTPPDWEVFHIVRRNLDFLGNGSAGKMIAVTSALQGEGKTTVASFLAFASAAAGKDTLLVECDLRKPVLAKRLGINRKPGLTDLANGSATTGDVIQRIPFNDLISTNNVRHSSNGSSDGTHKHELLCITAGSHTDDPVAVLRSERCRDWLSEARNDFEVVILDTPPLLVVVDALEVLPEATAIVFCVRSGSTTAEQARAGKDAFARLSGLPSGLVVTGARREEAPAYRYYGSYA